MRVQQLFVAVLFAGAICTLADNEGVAEAPVDNEAVGAVNEAAPGMIATQERTVREAAEKRTERRPINGLLLGSLHHDNAVVTLSQCFHAAQHRRFAVNYDGTFELPPLTNGVYTARDGVIASAEELMPRGSPVELNVSTPTTLVLQARVRLAFFQPQSEFPLKKMLKSPLALVLLGVGVIVLALPRLIDGMDDEFLEEMTGEKRPPVHNPNKLFKQLLGPDASATQRLPSNNPPTRHAS